MDSKQLAEKIKDVLDNRKGKEIVVIDRSGKPVMTDYFIIASGTTTTHVKVLADEVIFKLREEGRDCSHIEGYDSARWILLDYLDVVVHLFLEEDREYYNLERLWRDGARPSNQA